MQTNVLDDALCLARAHARCAGLNPEDAEDCAALFAARMLTASPPAADAGAWLRRCARNYVVDFVRARGRRLAHECRWPETVPDGSRPTAWDYPDGSPSVEATLLQDELRRLLMAALAELTPMPQQTFLRHHFSGESAEEIAASSDRTPHAVEQSLCRSRKHLRAALERRGLTETELRQYLADGSGPLLRWHSPTPDET